MKVFLILHSKDKTTTQQNVVFKNEPRERRCFTILINNADGTPSIEFSGRYRIMEVDHIIDPTTHMEYALMCMKLEQPAPEKEILVPDNRIVDAEGKPLITEA